MREGTEAREGGDVCIIMAGLHFMAETNTTTLTNFLNYLQNIKKNSCLHEAYVLTGRTMTK